MSYRPHPGSVAAEALANLALHGPLASICLAEMVGRNLHSFGGLIRRPIDNGLIEKSKGKSAVYCTYSLTEEGLALVASGFGSDAEVVVKRRTKIAGAVSVHRPNAPRDVWQYAERLSA